MRKDARSGLAIDPFRYAHAGGRAARVTKGAAYLDDNLIVVEDPIIGFRAIIATKYFPEALFSDKPRESYRIGSEPIYTYRYPQLNRGADAGPDMANI